MVLLEACRTLKEKEKRKRERNCGGKEGATKETIFSARFPET